MSRAQDRRVISVLSAAIVAVVVLAAFGGADQSIRRTALAAVDDPALRGSEPAATEWAPLASRQPSYDEDQSSGLVVTHLRIPSIGVDETVRAGMHLDVIDQGPAHWVGTALPGQQGNVVLAGHRTTHSAPFSALDRLVAGDLVFVTDAGGFDVIYRVTETFIVGPDEVWITYDNGEALLTMFACHPKGSAAQRIVVRAELVAGRLIA